MNAMTNLCVAVALALTTINVSTANLGETASNPPIIELADKLTRIFGFPDNLHDVKYYSFTSIRGQKVMIYNRRSRSQGPDWNVEYKIDKEWVQVPPDHSFISADLSPNQKVLMRVSISPGMDFKAGDNFVVEFGSAPQIDRGRTVVSGDSDWFLVYFHDHLFRNELTWRTTVTDSKGYPVEGAMAHFVILPDEYKPHKITIKEYITDASGSISGKMRFDECIGNNRTPPFTGVFSDAKTKWRATYNTGYWHLSVRGNDAGSMSVSPLTQICSSNMVK